MAQMSLLVVAVAFVLCAVLQPAMLMRVERVTAGNVVPHDDQETAAGRDESVDYNNAFDGSDDKEDVDEDIFSSVDGLPSDQLEKLSAVLKRASWAPSEIRMDQLMQKLRSRTSREKHSSAKRSSSSSRHASVNKATAAANPWYRLQAQLFDKEQHVTKKLHRVSEPSGEVPKRSADKRFHVSDDAQDSSIPHLYSYGSTAAELRDVRDIHPIYLGVGPSAVSEAYGAFARVFLLAKDGDNGARHDVRADRWRPVKAANPVSYLGRRRR